VTSGTHSGGGFFAQPNAVWANSDPLTRTQYSDGLLKIDDSSLTIRHYYFPLATAKRLPLNDIYSASEFALHALTGRWRIWGGGSLPYWSNLDPRRPRKRRGFVIRTNGFVRPVVTPDDPEAFKRALIGQGVPVQHDLVLGLLV
jgi:hypothetical protein